MWVPMWVEGSWCPWLALVLMWVVVDEGAAEVDAVVFG
jgi:hypothetical protein